MLELDLHTVQVHDPIVAADQTQPAPGHCLVVAVLEIDLHTVQVNPYWTDERGSTARKAPAYTQFYL